MSVMYFPAGLQMTNREQLHLVVAKLGVKIVLEELISMFGKYTEDYIVKLREDLQTTLKNYEDRYKE